MDLVDSVSYPDSVLKIGVKVSFFFRRYYAACQIANFCKHFTVPKYVLKNVQEQ